MERYNNYYYYFWNNFSFFFKKIDLEEFFFCNDDDDDDGCLMMIILSNVLICLSMSSWNNKNKAKISNSRHKQNGCLWKQNQQGDGWMGNHHIRQVKIIDLTSWLNRERKSGHITYTHNIKCVWKWNTIEKKWKCFFSFFFTFSIPKKTICRFFSLLPI